MSFAILKNIPPPQATMNEIRSNWHFVIITNDVDEKCGGRSELSTYHT
jgi:hypothetical protein